MNQLVILLYISGGFAILLGALHFSFPKRFGFFVALPADGAPLPPFRLWFYRYEMKRSDLRGIVYIMNYCVSYAILAVGVCDLFATRWLHTLHGEIAAGTIAGFWLVRASAQFHLGHQKGDWFVAAWFTLLAGVHIAAAFQ